MKRIFEFVSLVSLLLASATARADDPFRRSFDALPVKPTISAQSGIAQEGALMPDQNSIRAALLIDAAFDILALHLGSDKLGNLIPYRVDAHAIFAYQVLKHLEVGASLPVTLAQGNNFSLLNAQGFSQPGITSFGLSDARVMARYGILDPSTFPVGLAAILEIRAPTGAEQSFLGARSPVFAPRLSAELPLGPLRVLVNAGFRLREPGQFLNLYVGNEFQASGGVIYRFKDQGRFTRIEALGEMHIATPTNAPFTFSQADSLKSPWEVLLGGRTHFARNWGAEVSLGRGVAVETGYGREAFRIIAGIRYDFEPLPDRDHDGIPDKDDLCVDVPEDKDGYQDSDGCPDPDNDGDGLADGEDRCPMEPGKKELDGCPDRDGDDIPDIEDKCPDDPGVPEKDGCPEEGPTVEIESDRIKVRGNIQYEINSAEIKKDSFKLLDDVAKLLAKNPTLGPVLIEGHTDNTGSRTYNLGLSDRRAKSVEEYLVKKGIDRKRLQHKGYGFDRPIAPNDTALGRAKNRRTDFRLITDKDEKEEGSDSVKAKTK